MIVLWFGICCWVVVVGFACFGFLVCGFSFVSWIFGCLIFWWVLVRDTFPELGA